MSNRRGFIRPHRPVSVVAALVAATLALAGCANQPGPTSTAAPAAPTQTSQTKNLPDPRSLSGVSTVPELGDPKVLSGQFVPQLPVTVTDIEGTSVTVSDVSRILALDIYGTLSRTVIALGLGEKIVGRSTSSTEEQLKDLPRVTENGHALNPEAVLALKPTVIIADRTIGPPEAFEQLRAAGVPIVFVSQDRTLEGNSQLMRSVAAALGMSEAGEELAKRTEAEITAARAEIKDWLPDQPLRTAFLYVRGKGGIFFILGQEYGVNALVEGIGGADIAAANGIKSMAPASAEALVSLNPEVYLMMTKGIESAGGIESVLQRPGVADTIAGKKPRVIAIPDGVALSFGPQTGEVLLSLARALYGVDK